MAGALPPHWAFGRRDAIAGGALAPLATAVCVQLMVGQAPPYDLNRAAQAAADPQSRSTGCGGSSIAQHRLREGLQAIQVDQLELATVDVDEAFVLEAPHHP